MHLQAPFFFFIDSFCQPELCPTIVLQNFQYNFQQNYIIVVAIIVVNTTITTATTTTYFYFNSFSSMTCEDSILPEENEINVFFICW